MSGLTQEQALTWAQAIWGIRAFARENRACLSTDRTTDARGYIIHTGPVTSYTIGYRRRSRNGNWYLTTQKGRGEPADGFLGAFEDALVECRGTRAGAKLERLIGDIRDDAEQ